MDPQNNSHVKSHWAANSLSLNPTSLNLSCQARGKESGRMSSGGRSRKTLFVVVQTHANILANVNHLNYWMPYKKGGVYVQAAPIFHILDFPFMFTAPAFGARQVTIPKFGPRSFCETVNEWRIMPRGLASVSTRSSSTAENRGSRERRSRSAMRTRIPARCARVHSGREMPVDHQLQNRVGVATRQYSQHDREAHEKLIASRAVRSG